MTTSCSSYISTRYYLINTEPAVEKSDTRFPFIVEAEILHASARYQDQIFYRTSNFNVGFYEYSQWVDTPAEMVRTALINALLETELFESIEAPGAVMKPDLILRGNIQTFDQVFTDKGLLAECEIALQLLKGDRSGLVWSYDAKESVRQKGKAGFPAAMSEAVDKAIGNAIASMEKSSALRKFADQKKKENTPTPSKTAAAGGSGQ